MVKKEDHDGVLIWFTESADKVMQDTYREHQTDIRVTDVSGTFRAH